MLSIPDVGKIVVPKETEGIAGIAARLFRARKLLSADRGRAVTQAQIAASVGVTEGQVGHWEKGRQVPDLPTIEKLAAALSVSPVWLSYGVGPMEPTTPAQDLGVVEEVGEIAKPAAKRTGKGARKNSA